MREKVSWRVVGRVGCYYFHNLAPPRCMGNLAIVVFYDGSIKIMRSVNRQEFIFAKKHWCRPVKGL